MLKTHPSSSSTINLICFNTYSTKSPVAFLKGRTMGIVWQEEIYLFQMNEVLALLILFGCPPTL